MKFEENSKEREEIRLESKVDRPPLFHCLLTAKVYIYIDIPGPGPGKKSNNSLLSLRYIAAIKLTLRFVKPDAEF